MNNTPAVAKNRLVKRRSRAEQRDATRGRLLAVARELFTAHGYDGASVPVMCKRAKVTHGALYHHFPDGKPALFAAVLREVQGEIVANITRAVDDSSGWRKLEIACDVYLDECSDPTVLAVVVRDGPRVLPAAQFDAIDKDATEPLMTGLLRNAVKEGVLRQVPVEQTARLLGAAFAEAGKLVAESKDRRATTDQLRGVLLGWLKSLKASCVVQPPDAPGPASS